MANFPINYFQGAPNVVSMPRANMNVDSGAGLLAEATSRMGETLAGIGMKVQQAQNAMELSTLQRKSEEINNASLMALQGVDPKDDESIQKIQQKRDTDLKGLTSKSQAVNDTFAMHLNSESPRWDMQFQGNVIQKKAKGAKDDFDLNAQQFLADGNQDAYLKLLYNAKATEVISQVEFDYRSKNATADSYLQQAENKINRGDAKSIEDADAMLTALGGDKLKLDPKQLEKRDNLKTQMYAAQNRKNGALATQQDKEQWDLYKKSEDGTLTQSMLDTSVISADEKRQIWNNYQTVQYQKAKTGVSALEEGDPTVLAEANKVIDLAPEKINEAMIYEWQKKGVGTKHITGLVDRWKKNMNEKDPVAKKYKSQLASLYEAKLFGEKIKPETSDAYMKVQGELDTFLATNPTDEQTQKYFSGLIREKVKSGRISSIFNWSVENLTPPGWIYQEYKKYKGKSESAPSNNPPKEYPDATWDTTNNMWVVVRNGRKMGVQ
jgi:hypothetical protein